MKREFDCRVDMVGEGTNRGPFTKLGWPSSWPLSSSSTSPSSPTWTLLSLRPSAPLLGFRALPELSSFDGMIFALVYYTAGIYAEKLRLVSPPPFLSVLVSANITEIFMKGVNFASAGAGVLDSTREDSVNTINICRS